MAGLLVCISKLLYFVFSLYGLGILYFVVLLVTNLNLESQFDSYYVPGVRVVKSGQQIDIYAPTIVSSAGVVNTFKKLVPVELARKTGV